MTQEQKKIIKYFILTLFIVLLDLYANFKGFSLGYIFSSLCLLCSVIVLFHFLFYRGTYQTQGKEKLLKKTVELYAMLGGLFLLHAIHKIYVSDNWRLLGSEAVFIALLFFFGYQKIKHQK